MTNITSRIENILESASEAGVAGAMMASVAWGFSFSLAQTAAAAVRLDDPNDVRTKRMSFDQINERRKVLERRASELAETLSWVTAYVDPDYAPNGANIVQRIESQDASVSFDEAKAEEVAELLGMDVADVEAAAKADAEERAAEQELQRRAIVNHRSEIGRTVQLAIDGQCGVSFELSDRDARRILERMAEKAETYEQARVTQAMRTRRRRRIAQIASERMLLEDVMNQCDEELDRLEEAEQSKAAEALAGETVA